MNKFTKLVVWIVGTFITVCTWFFYTTSYKPSCISVSWFCFGILDLVFPVMVFAWASSTLVLVTPQKIKNFLHSDFIRFLVVAVISLLLTGVVMNRDSVIYNAYRNNNKPEISIISPVQGQTLVVGKNYEIKWSTKNFKSDDQVYIEIGNGNCDRLLKTPCPPHQEYTSSNTGSFGITVGGEYKNKEVPIKISLIQNLSTRSNIDKFNPREAEAQISVIVN